MHGTSVSRFPTGGQWIYELKYDGFRCLALKEDKRVTLLSRNGRDMARSFPEIVSELSKLPGTLAIDGELVVIDSKGRPQFEPLARRALTTLPIAVQRAVERDPARLYAFDILWCRGKDQRRRPLLDRKLTLQKLLSRTNRVRYLAHTEEWRNLYDFALKMELEGIIAKRADSFYVARRTRDWLKIKTPIGQKREQQRFGK